MKICPHCKVEIRVRELPHQGLFNTYRICPDCGGSFTVDRDTKYRQAACLIIALISLVFTMLLYYKNEEWLIPALASYVSLGLIIYWGNRKLYFIPYEKDQKAADDT